MPPLIQAEIPDIVGIGIAIADFRDEQLHIRCGMV